MALQDAEYYSCVSTQSTTSEEAEVCLGLGDDIGINISIGDELPWDNDDETTVVTATTTERPRCPKKKRDVISSWVKIGVHNTYDACKTSIHLAPFKYTLRYHSKRRMGDTYVYYVYGCDSHVQCENKVSG